MGLQYAHNKIVSAFKYHRNTTMNEYYQSVEVGEKPLVKFTENIIFLTLKRKSLLLNTV